MSGTVPETGTLNIVIQMPEATGGNVGGETTSGGAATPADPKRTGNLKSNPVNNEDKNGQAMLATAVQAAKSIGTQAVNSAVSNIGLATGNYYAQQQAQSTLSAINTVAGLAMAASNPVTLAVAVAGIGISIGTQLYQDNKQREHENYAAEQYARKIGYSTARK